MERCEVFLQRGRRIDLECRFSKRLLGLNLLNLVNYDIDNDLRVMRLSKTRRLKEHIKQGIAITTKEMIRMGLYDSSLPIFKKIGRKSKPIDILPIYIYSDVIYSATTFL